MGAQGSRASPDLEERFDTYGLLVELEHQVTIRVGALGVSTFPVGFYFYTGSAKNGLIRRLERHLAEPKTKSFHWHIDYFLNEGNVRSLYLSTEPECTLNHRVFDLDRSEVLMDDFGSSDCDCPSHLAYLQDQSDLPLDNVISVSPDRFR